jgi:hypothetical protein
MIIITRNKMIIIKPYLFDIVIVIVVIVITIVSVTKKLFSIYKVLL